MFLTVIAPYLEASTSWNFYCVHIGAAHLIFRTFKEGKKTHIGLEFLPSATVVAERLYFHQHLSFCPREGGSARQHSPPRADPQLPRQTSLGRHPPGRHPLWIDPPGADTPPPGDRIRILLECILVLILYL